MPRRMWLCLSAACSVLLYKTADGLCPRCGLPGLEVPLTLRPPGT